MAEFFAMGGYGAYVWPAYGVSAAALAGIIVWVVRRRTKAKRRLKALEERRNGDG